MSASLKASHWLKEALCKDQTQLFTSFNPADVAEAKIICGECPVKKQCITANIDSTFVTAGTSKFDRLVMKHRRADSIDEPSFTGDERLLSDILRRIR